MQLIRIAGKSWLFILAVISLSIAMASCDAETEERALVRDQYYAFDPNLILQEISQHPQDAFITIEVKPQLIPLSQRAKVKWIQKDYMQIAAALFKVVWEETLDEWELNSLHFRLGCDNTENGFQQASFSLFKVVKIHEKPSRIERKISINLGNNSVSILEYEYYPKVTDWPSAKFSQLKISADDALLIAEKNGGKEKRLVVENKCDIVILLSPGSASFDGWLASYIQDGSTNLFRLEIDPLTGKYK